MQQALQDSASNLELPPQGWYGFWVGVWIEPSIPPTSSMLSHLQTELG